MRPPHVEVQNVGKCFRRYHADAPGSIHEALMKGLGKLGAAEVFWGLRDINFRADAGRTIGFLGRNGAGKSTLLRLIGGVGRPDEGTIRVDGRVHALLHLGAGFHEELSGRENAYINGVIGGLTRREVTQKLDSIIYFSELEQFIDSPLRVYSSGMKMRLAFSIAIHSAPDILLIDEVLAVGDAAFQRKCMERIAALKADGCTIILVSHDTGTMEDLCDEVLWLRAGRVVAHGPARPVVKQYMAEADARSPDSVTLAIPTGVR